MTINNDDLYGSENLVDSSLAGYIGNRLIRWVQEKHKQEKPVQVLLQRPLFFPFLK